MRKRILIVGGSGFVGTNILKKIDFTKYHVRATRNKSKKYYKNNKIKYFKGNLKSLRFCEKITSSVDIVVIPELLLSAKVTANPTRLSLR